MSKSKKIILAITALYIVAFISGCIQPLPEKHQTLSHKNILEELIPETCAPKETELPAVIETVYMIEGIQEKMNLHLFYDPEILFYTYYPEDMVVEKLFSEDKNTVNFIARFGGVIDPAAYLSITVYRKGLFKSPDSFLEYLMADSGTLTLCDLRWLKPVDKVEQQYGWAIQEYLFGDDEFVCALYAGEYTDHFYYLKTRYPIEYGDGFHPRADLIIAHFTWKDF